VQLVWQQAAHGLVHADIDAAVEWMQSRFPNSAFLR
jgi:hypothetical protein